MRKFLIVVLSVFVVSMLWRATSHAQSACIPYDSALERFGETYGEAPIARGVDGRGNLAMVFASADGSTWTIFVVYPAGNMACVVGAGTDWESIDHKALSEAQPQSF